MTRVLVRAYATKRDHLDAYDVERLLVPAIVDEATWIPELDREDLLYHRLFLAEKWLVLKLRYGHADPRDAGVGNIVNCGAAMYIAPVGHRQRRRPGRRLRRGDRPHGRAPVELRPRGGGRARRRRRRGDAPGRDRRLASSSVALRLAKDATRAAIEAVAEAAAHARRLARRRPRRRCARRSRRSTRSASTTREPAPERAHPEPAARDRGAADRARPARRDAAATTPRRCSAASTTAATPTRSPRWAARSRARSAVAGAAATGSRRSATASRIDLEEPGRDDGRGRRRRSSPRDASALERAGAGDGGAHAGRCPLEGDLDPAGGPRRARAPAGARGGQGRRRDRGALARRRRHARRPARGASQDAAPPRAARARARAARRARRAAAAARRPTSRTSSTRSSPRPTRRRGAPSTSTADRAAPGSAARPAACSASRSRTSRARASARSREGTGNWPVRGWFTARGARPGGAGALARGTARARPTSLAENIDGMPEDDDLNFTMLGVALLERCGPRLHALDVAKLWLDYLPPGRIFTAERVAMRNLLEALPAAGDGDAAQPVPRVDRRAAARRRLRLGAPRRPRRAPRAWPGEDARAQPHRERRLRRDVHGGRARRLARRGRRRPSAPTSASSVVPPREPARRGAALRARARAASGRRVVDALYERYGALPLGARDQQHRARRRGALRASTTSRRRSAASSRAAGTPTRTAPRSARSSARSGPIERALDGAAARPLRELAARLRRRSRSTSSPRARSRSHERRSTRSSRGRSTVPTPSARPAPLDGSTARRSSPRPTIPPTGPPGATALARWRDEARAHGYDGSAYEPARRGRRAASPSRSSGSGTSCSTTTRRSGSRPSGCSPRREREFGGFDGVVLWHAYPVIGIDERNQFDWYRDVPGLRELVATFQARGVRVFVDYNPWDVGTRREPVDDAEAVAELVRELGADGVFLDTMKEAHARSCARRLPGRRRSRASRRCRSRASPTTTSRGRSGSPTAAVPGVIRARWFEQRHMLHHTRRWNRSHAEELRSAWLNGVGMLVWENVFGVVGRLERARPRRCCAAMVDGAAPLRAPADARRVDAARRAQRRPAGRRLALAARRRRAVGAREPRRRAVRRRRRARRRAACRSRCRRAGSPPSSPAGVVRLRRRLAPTFPARETRARRRRPVARVAAVPDGLRRRSTPRAARARAFRRRETGIYGEAPYVEEWKPLPPRLHDFVEVERPAPRGPLRDRACARSRATGLVRSPRRARTPRRAARGCRPRTSGSSPPRRACSSAPSRSSGTGPRASTRDGRTRFAILKGGSAFRAEGSDWYVDGGPQPPEFSLQLLLAGGRCSARRGSASGWRSTCDQAARGDPRRRGGDAVRGAARRDAPRRLRRRRGQDRAPAPARPGARARPEQGRRRALVQDARRATSGSITLDLSQPDGRDALPAPRRARRRRARELPPGHARALGARLGRALGRQPARSCSRASPASARPARTRAAPGFGTLAEAMSGFAALNGEPDGPPLLPPLALADGVAALATAFAIMVALRAREETGRGQVVDTSLVEPLLTLLGPQVDGVRPARRRCSSAPATARATTRRATSTAPPTARWVAVSASATSIAERVLRLVGRADLVDAAVVRDRRRPRRARRRDRRGSRRLDRASDRATRCWPRSRRPRRRSRRSTTRATCSPTRSSPRSARSPRSTTTSSARSG